ncbi:MAG: M20/M25/M40 family metallo-hydrolase [Candidatus Firestonebacteria bacterium]|nr:M20/M25/M40 family metallo-hydrolase [Candidatus Firestonebacteria bacterium]
MIKPNRLLKTFLELSEIESPSGQEKKIVDWIIAYLKKLGITAVSDSFGNIIAKIEGNRGPYFILNAHIDTVQPCRNIKPCIKDGVITSGGDTVLGADDKAGVAAILEVISVLKENDIKHCSLEIIFTVQEETGTIGAQKLNYSLIDAKTGVTVDGEKTEDIILGAPYITNVDILITGKSAHSGVEPEKGISAIKVACDSIARLRLGKIDKETTANVGIIKGGEIRNSIPAKAEISAEVRSHNISKMNRYVNKMKKVFELSAKKYKAQYTFNTTITCHGYRFQKGSLLIKKAANSLRNQNLKPHYIFSGGGSDANVFHANNIKVVNIGTGARNIHTTNEEISIENLNKIPLVLLDMVKI